VALCWGLIFLALFLPFARYIVSLQTPKWLQQRGRWSLELTASISNDGEDAGACHPFFSLVATTATTQCWHHWHTTHRRTPRTTATTPPGRSLALANQVRRLGYGREAIGMACDMVLLLLPLLHVAWWPIFCVFCLLWSTVSTFYR
jgi:hypothetical protein